MTPRTRLVYVESVTNPLLDVIDLEREDLLRIPAIGPDEADNVLRDRAQLDQVDVLLECTGLSYAELLDVLSMRYVRLDFLIKLHFLLEESPDQAAELMIADWQSLGTAAGHSGTEDHLHVELPGG